MAVFNTFWIIVLSLLQFSGVFNNCYCGSSVIGLGRENGHYLIYYSAMDGRIMVAAWIVGALSAAICSFLFFVFIRLTVDALPVSTIG